MLKNLLLSLVLVPFAVFADSNMTGAKAAEWLGFVDAQQYENSWDEAALYFRTQISKDDWVQAVSSVRSSVGQLESRKLVDTISATSLPDIPAGEYVLFKYESVFSNAGKVTETLTLSKGNDGWFAVGYFIR